MAAHRTHVIDRGAHDVDEAIKALEAYGFENFGDPDDERQRVYMRRIGVSRELDPLTERWVPSGAGFACFKVEPDKRWGIPVAGQAGLYQIPSGVKTAYASAAGLHPLQNPEAYDLVWSAGDVWFMYEFAEAGWRREVDEDGTERMIWDGAAIS